MGKSGHHFSLRSGQVKSNVFDLESSKVKFVNLPVNERNLSKTGTKLIKGFHHIQGKSESYVVSPNKQPKQITRVYQQQRQIKDVVISKIKRQIDDLEFSDLVAGANSFKFQVTLDTAPKLKTKSSNADEYLELKALRIQQKQRLLMDFVQERSEVDQEISEIHRSIQEYKGLLRELKKVQTEKNAGDSNLGISSQMRTLRAQEKVEYD